MLLCVDDNGRIGHCTLQENGIKIKEKGMDMDNIMESVGMEEVRFVFVV